LVEKGGQVWQLAPWEINGFSFMQFSVQLFFGKGGTAQANVFPRQGA
jgi:hypothetical protein